MLAACQMADSHFKGSGKTLHQIGESYPVNGAVPKKGFSRKWVSMLLLHEMKKGMPQGGHRKYTPLEQLNPHLVCFFRTDNPSSQHKPHFRISSSGAAFLLSFR
jgi:hypothetical protein